MPSDPLGAPRELQGPGFELSLLPLPRHDVEGRARTGGRSRVSFEALYLPGHFLRHKGAKVVLEKSDASAAFKQSATFLREPGLTSGLADAPWSSFRALDAPGKYLRQAQGVLRVEGVSLAKDKGSATFRLVYWGRCRSRSAQQNLPFQLV